MSKEGRICPTETIAYPSIHPSIRPSIHPSIYPSIHLSIYLVGADQNQEDEREDIETKTGRLRS